MKKIDRNYFLKNSTRILEEMLDIIEEVPIMKMDEIRTDETALVIVDLINGFAREGMLKSERVETLIPNAIRLIDICDSRNILKIAFADSHEENCIEFDYYPIHCVKGTKEAEIVNEIKEKGNYKLFYKNSTNGFLESEFTRWLNDNSGINNFILAGDCTDICILQFALTLKAHFNILNRRVNIIVPMDVVDTFDLGTHSADLMNVFSLYILLSNGINVVKHVEG